MNDVYSGPIKGSAVQTRGTRHVAPQTLTKRSTNARVEPHVVRAGRAMGNTPAHPQAVSGPLCVQALERTLLEYDMSLPGVAIAPQLGAMTLGAAIVTSAHGSSLVGPASIAQFLHSALLVDGTGARRPLTFQAAVVGVR
jgi:hypothetical protein